MKRFFDPCRGRRQSLALLVAGVLPEPEQAQIATHLSACAHCRDRLAELKATAAPLMQWADGAAQVQPSVSVKARWAKAIRTVANPNPATPATPVSGFGGWWQDVVWPSRGIWAGLAAVWVLILAGDLSAIIRAWGRENLRRRQRKS